MGLRCSSKSSEPIHTRKSKALGWGSSLYKCKHWGSNRTADSSSVQQPLWRTGLRSFSVWISCTSPMHVLKLADYMHWLSWRGFKIDNKLVLMDSVAHKQAWATQERRESLKMLKQHPDCCRAYTQCQKAAWTWVTPIGKHAWTYASCFTTFGIEV